MTDLEDHFSDRADLYARHRPRYGPELVAFLAGLGRAHELVWEPGCGSGQLSVQLGAAYARVHATDASEAQLRRARPAPHVTYRCEPAGACSLPDRVADLVVVAQAAHWFDLEAFYAEARRVARPGAALALLTYGRTLVSPDVDRVVAAFHGGTLGPYWPAGRRHVDAGYATLPFPFPELPAPTLSMTATWSVEDYLGYVRSWSGVRALLRTGGDGELAGFGEALRRVWPDGEVRTVRWPLAFRLGRL